jgi:hypothetical protein
MILNEIDSIHDLYSFMGASSRVHVAFLPVKEWIVSNLLKRVLSADRLHDDAPSALRSSEFPFPEGEDEDGYEDGYEETSTTPKVVEPFLQFIRDFDDIFWAHKVIPLDLSLPLCKLQSAIEYLIEDFCAHSSSHLSQDLSATTNLSMDGRAPLSATELVRLKRASYRYNTCQNMMRASVSFKSDFERVYVKLTKFLECFELCEAEEIGCVHDYMLRRFDRVEN